LGSGFAIGTDGDVAERSTQIVRAARRLLEEHGADALTMRELANQVGIRASSLYKHVPDKGALETMLIADGLSELAEALEATERREPGSLAALATTYRQFALDHPHLYRLIHNRPLPRQTLPEGLEERTAMPVARALGGDEHLARAAWAFAHGMVILELNHRFPPDADLSVAWLAAAAAFTTASTRSGQTEVGRMRRPAR
jgi:AcrR family transcriptional regulator